MTKKLLILLSVCLAIVTCPTGARDRIAAFDVSSSEGERWHIKGVLSEACTCNVPCTCNFGEGPSPHPYCYVVYSYEIREGHFNGVKLDGLRLGGIETARGKACYLDARAGGQQRAALEAVARKVMRISGDRMGGSRLLGINYVEIKQEYDESRDSLSLGGSGAFKTNYLMGRDKSKPVIVVNNTEWPIHEAIKGKTESFTISDEYGNNHSAKNSNSNHGDFEFDEKTRFGNLSCSTSCSPDKKGETKHRHND